MTHSSNVPSPSEKKPSEESLKIADELAVASRRQTVSCVDLQYMIARALDAMREKTVRECAEIAHQNNLTADSLGEDGCICAYDILKLLEKTDGR